MFYLGVEVEGLAISHNFLVKACVYGIKIAI